MDATNTTTLAATADDYVHRTAIARAELARCASDCSTADAVLITATGLAAMLRAGLIGERNAHGALLDVEDALIDLEVLAGTERPRVPQFGTDPQPADLVRATLAA